MDELKQKLMDQLGLDDGKASSAIEMVMNFAKDKLPDNISGLLDGVMNGETPDASSALDAVKGLFGK